MIHKPVEPATATDIAKTVICNHLNTGMNIESVNAVYEIKNGNKEILLEHVKALRNIFDMAVKEIEKEIEND